MIGAEAITLSGKILWQSLDHPLIDKGLDIFNKHLAHSELTI